jgi:putative transposase
MARLPRLVIPHFPHYVSQFGNNRQAVFIDDEDYGVFKAWMKEASQRFDVAIHAYALQSNHMSMMLTPTTQDGLARFMQWLGRHYVPYFNQKYGRTGTLWEGRYRTSIVQAPQYVLLCSHYIESMVDQAAPVASAKKIGLSSLAHHIGEKNDPLLRVHASYWGLGNTPFEREMQYRLHSESAETSEAMPEVAAVLTKGGVLGTATFKEQLEKLVGRKLGGGKRGRPAKVAA